MKKTLIIGSIMALSLVGASSAQAQIKAETRAELKKEIEVKKQEIKTMKTERASTTTDAKLAKLNEAVKSSQIHLTKELSRLNDAKTKIESRLAKFEQAGANVTVAKADLALAITALATVQTKINAVGTVQAGTDTKAFAEALRTAVKAAQSSINDARKALSKVTSDMKGLEASIKRMKNATSTASSTRN